MKKIVLIVLNYNDYKTTLNFLNKVKQYNSINKIIVVDNNSSDNSYEKLLEYKNEKIDVIRNKVNSGYASGNNLGVKYAMNKYFPEYIIISNPDVHFEEVVVNKLVSRYIQDKELAIVAPKMNSINFPNEPIAWRLPSFVDNVISNFIILSKILPNKLEYNDLSEHEEKIVDVLPGSFFMIDANKFKCINYFNENTFLYCEEIILAHKLKEKGYKSIILNNIEYIHEHSVSIDKAYNSVLKKYYLLNQSKNIYTKECLKKNNIYVYLNNIIFLASQLEKAILICIKRGISYVKK